MFEFLSNLTWVGWTLIAIAYLFIGMVCALVQMFNVVGEPNAFDYVIVVLTFLFWPLWMVVRVFIITLIVLFALAITLAVAITGH